MIGVALGDARTRIEWTTERTLTTVDRYMPAGPPAVIEGTFRAIAMLRLIPDDELINRIIAFVMPLDPAHPLRYWVAAASAGWTGLKVDAYLRSCINSSRADLREVATTSLARTYASHRPL